MQDVPARVHRAHIAIGFNRERVVLREIPTNEDGASMESDQIRFPQTQNWAWWSNEHGLWRELGTIKQAAILDKTTVMFARSTLRTVASSARAQTFSNTRSASSVASKVQNLADKSVYYSKVALELSKAVYTKEGLAPPTIAEFTKVFECAQNQAKLVAKDPKAFLDVIAKNAQGFNKDEIIRYFCYFIQVVGFFSLGEIIGRRNVVGYAEH